MATKYKLLKFDSRILEELKFVESAFNTYTALNRGSKLNNLRISIEEARKKIEIEKYRDGQRIGLHKITSNEDVQRIINMIAYGSTGCYVSGLYIEKYLHRSESGSVIGIKRSFSHVKPL
jgi:hypothetical protein